MERRLELHSVLEGILGSKNVYLQSPGKIAMKYPCILYEREPNYTRHANDSVYLEWHKYHLTYIDKKPDSDMPDRLLHNLPYARMNRVYTVDNLNHYSFSFYY